MRLRRFEAEDALAVADLFARVFRRGKKCSLDSLSAYVRGVYFGNPLAREDLPSLVVEGEDGRLDGFLGVLPRRMRLRGREITVAVAGNWMVRPQAEAGGSLVAVALARAFLAGPQDLALTDTATDLTRRVWEACGGQTAHLYSFHWVRPLRPFRFGLEEALRRGIGRPLARLLRPLCRLPDALASPVILARSRRSASECRLEDLQARDLSESFSTMPEDQLAPGDDASSLDFILGMAAQKEGQGTLARRRVRVRRGDAIGWFVLYQNPLGVSDVLQIAGDTSRIGDVLDCAIDEARRAGAAALRGRIVPSCVTEFTKRLCFFYNAGSWVLVHARDASLASPFLTGKAFFTGLEGEAWTRFAGDPFEQ